MLQPTLQGGGEPSHRFLEIPSDLKLLPRWVCWRYRSRNGRLRKVPVRADNGEQASVTNPADWSTFEAALAASTKGRRPPAGVGFVFTAEDGLVGVDLDCCRDPNTGMVEEWALDIISRLATYAEVSPSGSGVKLVARGHLATGGGRRDNIEMYAHSRFFTLTGERLPGAPTTVCECQGEIDLLYRKVKGSAAVPVQSHNASIGAAGLNDVEVADHIARGDAGPRFAELWAGDTSRYQSTSEADLALCGGIARMVGPNRARVEAVFNLSALAARDKWVEREDYRERTVKQAVDGLGFQSTSAVSVHFKQVYSGSIRNTHGRDAERPASETTANDDFPAEHNAVRGAEALACEQEKSMPDWHAIFDLTRRLKTFADRPFPLEAAVKAYCDKSGRSFDEVWIGVQSRWDHVHTPEGMGDWDWACRMASTNTLTFRPERGSKYELAASLAYYLSLLNSQFPFPVQKVGEFLGVSGRAVTDAVRLLIKDGVITRVAAANRRAGKASEYRMLGKPMSREEGSSHPDNLGEFGLGIEASERRHPCASTLLVRLRRRCFFASRRK